MNEELLLKYITGQATEGEKITILNWLEEHPDNRLKFNRLKNTWVISKLPETKAPEASVLQYSRKIRHRKQNRRILGYGIAASFFPFKYSINSMTIGKKSIFWKISN